MVDLTFQTTGVKLSNNFEDYVTGKAEKITQVAAKSQELQIKVKYLSAKKPELGVLVELTVITPKRPVVRAEAQGQDDKSAFDVALDKIVRRLRRFKERQLSKRHREGGVADLGGAELPLNNGETVAAADEANAEDTGYSPIVVRTKEFAADTLSAEQAIDQLELIGHDFYLYQDADTGKPSVVYRRKGWNYGVISLKS